ncbi:hypothetical protein BU24DRAFT_420008 [Aaosphaeria arxii CBS 175.79]|uniref:Uncharacterized protein n=1 Tax=Aaosphaeria arxii CBS 175.79 TaxID=1450172 RepID=A0A6A5XVJ5_9PLEO|nr:uncharacterized protein BU24DRAFT_420008 [Aaosphaeria arxii CBS 175.79]KAF2016969.1 hypothetical protein BU24DRAFT_420008 [Aaosphaeria arxii CBS 175.79]
MRFSTIALALPAVALAQNQVPLAEQAKGWFNKLTNAVSSAAPAAPSNPIQAGAAKVADSVQHELTLENWKQVVTADPTVSAPATQDWLIYINGGNATCYGFCGNTTKAWNESVALISAKPNPPKFGIVDCDAEPILCNSWSVGPPSLYYFNIPKPLADQSAPAVTARFIPLNRTSTTVDTIKKLVLDKEYEQVTPYEGAWHPFNGQLAEFGLATPVAYALWGFSKMPSWLPMIMISFLSRTFMNKRMAAPNAGQARAAPAQ